MGGATDNIRAVEIDAAVADRNLMGWTHWAYKQWQDPTTADDAQGMFHDDTDFSSVKTDKLRVLVRTYAQATAGTPLAMDFDAATGAFSYRYRSNAIDAPTEIFVSPLHYPRGYDVRVTGGHWAPGTGGRIEVRPDVAGAGGHGADHRTLTREPNAAVRRSTNIRPPLDWGPRDDSQTCGGDHAEQQPGVPRSEEFNRSGAGAYQGGFGQQPGYGQPGQPYPGYGRPAPDPPPRERAG